jgi:hypothetical protein
MAITLDGTDGVTTTGLTSNGIDDNATSTAVTINSSGTVGIGTTTPNAAYALDVVGSIRATNSAGSTIIANRTSAPGSVELQYSGTQTAQFSALSGGGVATYVGSTPTEVMRIDASGNVGIGTSSPLLDFVVSNNGAQGFEVNASGIISGGVDVLSYNRSTSAYAPIYNNASYYVWATSTTERMRLDASGNLLWANTGGVSSSQSGIVFSNTTHSYIQISGGSDTNFRYRMEFINGNGQVGTITTNGSSTSYNTSSDYRLKENLVGLDNGIDRLKQIPVYRFNFIADPNTTVDGFIAHEVQDVVPEAISGSKDAVDAEGNPEYQGIDQSKLVPLLTAALQEAITKIEDLESRLSAVEAN